MRERDIEAHLVDRVREVGGEVRKVRFLDRRGAPDRLVMLPPGRYITALPPRCVWVELKATGKKPEAHQLREHARLRKMGQEVLVLDSIEAVENFMGPF